MKRSLIALIMILALLVPASTAFASSIYYVRQDGNDANAGLTNDAAGAWKTLQYALDNVASGDVIKVAAGSYAGGLTVDTDYVTLQGGAGVVVTGGSPAITVNANDFTLLDVDIDGEGTHPTDSGIVVAADLQNLWIERCQIQGWGLDGLHLSGTLTGIKVVDNLFFSNGSDGIEATLLPGGPISIYGNAFFDNGAYGINNSDPAPAADLPAEYNEWGHLDGPASGDTASANVDADPWVYAKLWVAPASQTVREGEALTAYLKMDVHHLYGAALSLDVPTTLVQLVSEPVVGAFETATEGAAFATNGMADINATGQLDFTGYRAKPDAEYDAADDTLLTLDMVAQEIATSQETGDLQFLPESMRMGAKGGVNILMDTVTCGKVTVLGTTSVKGSVDLQGRSNESGAVADPAAGTAYGWDAAAETTGAWGTYSFSDLTDDSYTISIEMPRYLDASATVVVSGDNQTLAEVELLGGDANDSDNVDISDIAIIGGQYGNEGASLTDPRADINADNMADILDLVLAGGNYGLTESPWTP